MFSVGHDDRGKPLAVLCGRALEVAREQGVTEVYLSISHTRDVAVANAAAATPASQPKRPERVDEKAVITAARFKRSPVVARGARLEGE